MKTVLGILVLVLYHQLGIWLMAVLHWPIPGGVAGMVLLFFSLLLFKKPPPVIAAGSGFLLKYLALLFVPAGVGIMLLFDLLANEWLAMLVSMVLSTVISLMVTGLLLNSLVKKPNQPTQT
jgi:holin-like protein